MKFSAQPATPDTPFVMIVGAMKCGTTALFDYLRAHPAVCPCREKEPGFFAFPDKYARGLDAYLRLWNFDPASHQIALEATTNYTKHPGLSGVAERIAKDLNDVRFIYLMRDPVARIESQFNHEIFEGRIDWDEPIVSDRLLAPSLYATQLRQYSAHFPRERILLLNAGNLSREAERVVREVCTFIGVDPDIVWPSFTRVHETQGLTRFEEWLRRGPFPAVRKLPRPLRKRLFRGPTVEKRRMTAAERAEAWTRLAPEMDALESEFGFDTTTLRASQDS